MSLLRGIARQAHTENCRWRIEEELKCTAKALAATRRMKEYQDRAAEKGTKRTKTDQEEERQQREHGESTARMEEDAPTSSSKWQWRRGTNAGLEQQQQQRIEDEWP